MSTKSLSRKFAAMFGMLLATFALALAVGTPTAAFAATPDSPTYTLSSYNTPDEKVGSDNGQHIVLTIDYGAPVTLEDDTVDAVMGGNFDITIAGYSIKSADYKRPVTAVADGNKLVLDIGNCVDGNGVPSFTAVYGGVIQVTGTPANVDVDGASPSALSIYTVVPTGIHVSMTAGEGTSTLSATVDHVANIRGMYHVALYDGATGSMVPVNAGGTAAGNLKVGAYTSHAHKYMTMGTAQFASAIAGFSLPEGYAITANGSDLTVTGPAGSKLYLYIFDDNMLQELGQTFNGVISNEGVMTDFLPGQK